MKPKAWLNDLHLFSSLFLRSSTPMASPLRPATCHTTTLLLTPLTSTPPSTSSSPTHLLLWVGMLACSPTGHKLTCCNRFEDNEVSERIRTSIEALAAAIAKLWGDRELDDAILEDAAVAMCAHSGSLWINHSCSPATRSSFLLCLLLRDQSFELLRSQTNFNW